MRTIGSDKQQKSLALVLALFAAAGCNALIGANDPTLAMDAAVVAGCVLNSDCSSAIEVCIFRVCSPPCHTDGDCASGSRCLKAADAGTACVANDIAGCGPGQSCPAGSTCDMGSCRNPCQSKPDCLGGQSCAGGVCVGTDPSHDRGVDGGIDGSGVAADASPVDALPDAAAMEVAAEAAPIDGAGGDVEPDASDGAQMDAACVPNTKRCAPGGVQTCGADDTWSTPQVCPYVCAGGQCTGVCAPTAMQCGANSTPQTCDSHGQWTSGTRCTNVCVNGACAASCLAGTRQCNSGVPQTCVNGAWMDGNACPYVCNNGACTGLCVPNSTQCSTSTQQQTCDATGQWASTMACPYVCTGKACGGVCAPNDTKCSSGTQQATCDSTGQWGAPSTCPYVCTGKACGGVCTPSSTQCTSGTQQETCASDGTWGAPVSCAHACIGTGVSSGCGGVCAPNSTQCTSSTQQEVCNSSGQWGAPATCTFACVGTGLGSTCGGVCVPETTRCSSSSQQQTCGADGQWQPATSCMYACVGAGVGGACGGVCAPSSRQCSDSTHNATCDNTGQWGTPAACLLPYPPNPGCTNGNCAYHGGLDHDGGGMDTLPGTYIYAIQFSVSVPTTASRLGMFTKATGHSVRMGIYSNASNNVPQTLQSQTATFATAAGVIEAPLAAPVTLNGTYWIAAIADADIAMAVTTSGGFTWNNNSLTWPSLPNGFPSGAVSNTSETPDFYVVLQAQ